MIDRALLWLAFVFVICGIDLLVVGEAYPALCFFAVAAFSCWLARWEGSG